MRHWVLTVALVLAGLVQEPQVRLSLVDAASGHVMTFAQALAQRGIAGGVIISEAAYGGPRSPVTPETGPPKGTLENALERFNGSQRRVTAAPGAIGVLIRGDDVPAHVDRALREARLVDDFEGPAWRAIFESAGGLLRMSATQTHGYIGSGAVPSSGCPFEAPVKIARGTKAVTQILDEIVTQAPGLVWLITYAPAAREGKLKIGYVCPDGVTQRVSVPGW
ncbi:MAG: hypothetical protein M3Q55_05475 [Acidobacteriota bacterium]|nr:hypothetical protein [Acidobacteriota bacterium]